eukprot:scaffold126916_cov34-Tisochrysis_lutea.AAC.1
MSSSHSSPPVPTSHVLLQAEVSDALSVVCDHLDLLSLARLRRVCKKLKHTVSSHSVWTDATKPSPLQGMQWGATLTLRALQRKSVTTLLWLRRDHSQLNWSPRSSAVIRNMSTTAKQHMLQLALTAENVHADLFMPRHGVTLGDFATWFALEGNLADALSEAATKADETATTAP